MLKMAKAHGGKRVGAGRKPAHPEGATMLVTVSVPSGLVERLDALAGDKGWNRSEAFTEAVRRILKRR
jgi:hypothetical protein